MILLAGCSGDDSGYEGLDEPVATPTLSESDKIERVYAAYWDAIIASENGPDPSPELFDDVAVGHALQQQIRRVRDMVESDAHRVGEPNIGEPQITVNDTTARVEACVDQDSWDVVVDGTTLPPTSAGPQPAIADLQQFDGTWLVTRLVPQSEATLTC
jgi:hypothetical protein